MYQYFNTTKFYLLLPLWITNILFVSREIIDIFYGSYLIYALIERHFKPNHDQKGGIRLHSIVDD